MSNNLLTTQKVLPADAFVDDGDHFGGDDLLLFDGKTGKWTNNRDKDEVPIGTKVVAIVDQLLTGYIRFYDRMPRYELRPIWPKPDLHALRQSLGDLDQKMWLEHDANGDPQDPWRKGRHLPVILVETCDCLVYSTTSKTGISAVSKLKDAVRKERCDLENADALPILALDAETYHHKKFGRLFIPILDITRWTTLRAVEQAMRSGNFNSLIGTKPSIEDRREREPAKVAPKRPRR